MASAVLVLVFLVSNSLVYSAPKSCPIACICNDHQHITSCRNGQLDRIPWNLPDPSGLKELDMTDNRIQSLTSQIVSYPNLEVLNLSENELSIIDGNIFDALNRLKRLSLHKNQLSVINAYVFQGLRSLQVLDLSSNQLEVLTEETFADLESLEELDLESNRLNQIDNNTFRNLGKLRYLKLSDNLLNVFPSTDGLFSLKFLYLDMNRIQTVPSRAFRTSTDIELLSIDDNRVSRVADDAFNTTGGCSGIRWLSIQNNLLQQIPQVAFTCLTNLKTLDLSGNLIESLSKHDLKGLSKLKILILNNLPNLKVIRNGSFSSLLALRELIISSNHQFSSIEHGSLGSYINLRRLDLHGNALEVLDQDLVNWDSLEYLDLRYNKWYCNCHLHWLPATLTNLDRNETSFLNQETRCSQPPNLSSRSISSLRDADLDCNEAERVEELKRKNEDKILFALLGGVCSILFVIMIFVLCKYKNSFLNPSSGTFPYSTYVPPNRRRPSANASRQQNAQVIRANQLMNQSDEKLPAIKEKKSEVRFSLDIADPV